MIELTDLQKKYGLNLVYDGAYTKLKSRAGDYLGLATEGNHLESSALHQAAHAYLMGCLDGMPVAVES